MKNKPIIIGIIALFIIVLTGLVYALFTQDLNITGTANVRNSKWKIYFSRIEKYGTWSETAIELTSPTINQNTPTTIDNYAVSLTTPGDSISYLVEVTNEGDYDAVLSDFTINARPRCKVNNSESDESAINVCSKLNYAITYQGGASLQKNIDILKSKQKAYFVLTLSYAEFDDASLLPTNNVIIDNLGLQLVYTQSGKAKVNSDGTTTYYDYVVGDRIQVDGDTSNSYYRVIANSPANDDYVVALKEEPLTVSEVNTYGNGHVNMYNVSQSPGTAHNYNGYGGMAYYSSPTCGIKNGSYVWDGCTVNYDDSEIKYVVDEWANINFVNDDLKMIDGYTARLIKYEELTDNLGYKKNVFPHSSPSSNGETPSWVYNNNYSYWTMSQYNDSAHVFSIDFFGDLNFFFVYDQPLVRPVINVYKSKIAN